jgi:hypothetical protein
MLRGTPLAELEDSGAPGEAGKDAELAPQLSNAVGTLLCTHYLLPRRALIQRLHRSRSLWLFYDGPELPTGLYDELLNLSPTGTTTTIFKFRPGVNWTLFLLKSFPN